MAVGPCGTEFREAFTCFHYSEEETKGSECYEVFAKMQECMSQNPELYGSNNQEENAEDAELLEEAFDASENERKSQEHTTNASETKSDT